MMQVFALFEHSPSVELALTKLEQEGVDKEHILVVPIDETSENLKVFDSLHDSDGISFIDKAMALATAFGVVGTSIGFKLEWGPIIWGLIAAFIGFLCGLVWNICIIKFTRNGYRKEKRVLPLIMVIVECDREAVKGVEIILRENKVIGYSTTG
ncbi:hypothetical protein [Paenibacillus tarimensis]|uniref:hypothetical protein n=1 Tax=Paenibacillus tarimensis TaxID=416012 RepID=UPI001F2A41F6|nr:hypothetical protein [Paenibacillus tarimensis]MCF2944428.1 hypothetical protein [Paenibacillus tarimensis]